MAINISFYCAHAELINQLLDLFDGFIATVNAMKAVSDG